MLTTCFAEKYYIAGSWQIECLDGTEMFINGRLLSELAVGEGLTGASAPVSEYIKSGTNILSIVTTGIATDEMRKNRPWQKDDLVNIKLTMVQKREIGRAHV